MARTRVVWVFYLPFFTNAFCYRVRMNLYKIVGLLCIYYK
jgi:hypothetical protein